MRSDVLAASDRGESLRLSPFKRPSTASSDFSTSPVAEESGERVLEASLNVVEAKRSSRSMSRCCVFCCRRSSSKGTFAKGASRSKMPSRLGVLVEVGAATQDVSAGAGAVSMVMLSIVMVALG